MMETFTVDWVSRHPKHSDREIIKHTLVLSSSAESAKEHIQRTYADRYLRAANPLCVVRDCACQEHSND